MIIPIQTWADAFTASFQGLLEGVVGFLPNVIFAVLIFILGWLVGAALGRIVSQIVHSLRLDVALKNTPLNEGVERAGFSLDSGAFLGTLVKWFVIIVFLVASLDVLELTQVNIFLQTVVLSYLPKVIVAVLIIVVGALVAEVAKDIVAGSAKAARIRSANFVGSLAKWSIWIFAILAALDQLQVASSFVQTLFTGVVVAISLAVGLSFGLGGQEAAARYIERLQSEIDHKN
jgi:xanthosine utilization system XapX-like protein